MTPRNAPHMRRICAGYAPDMRRICHIISLHITPFHSITFHYRKPLSPLRRILYIKPSVLFFFGSFFLLRQKEPSRGVYKHKVNRIPKKIHAHIAPVNDADEIKKPPEIGGFLFGDFRLLFFLLVAFSFFLSFFDVCLPPAERWKSHRRICAIFLTPFG